MTKLNLTELKVQSFITNAKTKMVFGGAGLGGFLGETLQERPCTCPSREPEGCNQD